MPSKADDYTIIPVKFSSRVSGAHEIFVKPDSSAEGADKTHRPRGKTLFLANIPPWMGHDDIANILLPTHPLEVIVQKEAGPHLPMNEQDMLSYSGFKVAYAVYKDKADVTQVMTRRGRGEFVVSQERGTELVGMRRWTEAYARRWQPPHELQRSVAQVVGDYDRRAEEEKRRAKQLEQPDEDGWVTVTKHGKRPVIPRTEAIQARVLEKEKAKDSRKHLTNFYAFQAKRNKLDKLQELRRKFEEDKRKVAIMKAQRRFRPA